MRHLFLKASSTVLLVLVACALSNAQTAKPDDDVSIWTTTNVDRSSEADGLPAQDYVSSPGKTTPDDPAPGYISGTILDQSGAVNVGADVRLADERQTFHQQVKSGGNGEFLFTAVAAGSFHLTVKSPGFSTREFSATLLPGETYLVPPIILTVAPAVTELHVSDHPLTPVQVADMQVNEQQKQRVFGFIPNFYVSYDRDALPLNAKQKFKLAWKTTSDPFTIVGVAALAGIEQAANAFDGYGQGTQGYFKRLGASYADAIAGTYIGSAMLPSLLKQDPRYFYKGTGSARSRLLYALATPVICKGDNMHWQPNYSNVAGSFAAAGISYLYYPQSDRNAGLVVQNSLIRLGEMAFEGVLQEFVVRRFTPHLRNRASERR
jgi:hypothetical protein